MLRRCVWSSKDGARRRANERACLRSDFGRRVVVFYIFNAVCSGGAASRLVSVARRSAPSEIKAYVKRVASLPNGRYRLTLDNDQVWQTTEADWAVEFNAEDAVTISRLPLGGYQIALSGENRTLSVKRTQ